ncbi:transposase InsI for insertion sequence element IS30A [Spirochaetia bacterium]|nr:transposase InsI for insertion sequence element IS30A [Spirochaetia bacterium]
MGYKRMTFVERMDIFRLLYVEKQTKSKTASLLGRKPSTISRELKKGMDNGMYNPLMAEIEHLKARKQQSPKLKIDGEVWNLIKPQLERRWSPEEIAKWLEADYPEHTMSGKTIYNYVQFHMKGELKKLALEDLRQRGKSRKSGNRAEKRGKIPGMTLIDTRPAEINARTVAGHWEGDLIIGKNHKSAICVTVERKTRFIQLDLLRQYDAQTVRKTIEKRFKKLEPALRKSLTLDQGHENSEHRTLTENLGIAVYFCHPHSPWEKATCENTNYLIRDMLYPIDDFRELTQRDVSRIARLLNERPRQTLDFKTPKEVFSLLR